MGSRTCAPGRRNNEFKDLGTHKGQQARVRVARGKLSDQLFVGHGKNAGSSVSGMGSLLDRREVQFGMHFRRIPPVSKDSRRKGGKDRDEETIVIVQAQVSGQQ